MKKPQRLWAVVDKFSGEVLIAEDCGYARVCESRGDLCAGLHQVIVEVRLVPVKPKRKAAKRGRGKK